MARQCLRIALMCTCAATFAKGPLAAGPPDPWALLQGAEASRRAVTTGRIEFAIEQQWARRKPINTNVEIVFDGPKRTIRLVQDEVFFRGPSKTESAAQMKQMAALGHDWDKATKAGIGHKETRSTRQAYDGIRFCWYQEAPHLAASYRDFSSAAEMTFDPRTL